MNISPFKKLKIVIMKLSKLNEILKHGNLCDHIPHHRDNTIKMQRVKVKYPRIFVLFLSSFICKTLKILINLNLNFIMCKMGLIMVTVLPVSLDYY